MSKRKGVSADEKRARIMQIFHETQDFFQLKEIEKIASKEKGINVQLVKGIVQNLVDDGLIDSDKIGMSVYYWSYPSKELNKKKKELQDLDVHKKQVEEKLKIATEALQREKVGKDESQEQLILIEEIQKLSDVEKELRVKLQTYQDNDPEMLQKMKEDTKILFEAVNRWTDNIFSVKSWCKTKFMIEESKLDKQFDIPSDLDYIDEKILK